MPKNPEIQKVLDDLKPALATLRTEAVGALKSGISSVGGAARRASDIRAAAQAGLLATMDDPNVRTRLDNYHRTAARLEKICHDASDLHAQIISLLRQIERDDVELRARAEEGGYVV